jgi:hypothetical protein
MLTGGVMVPFLSLVMSTKRDPNEEARTMLHPDVYIKLTNLHIEELQREADRRRLVRAIREDRVPAIDHGRRGVPLSHLRGAGLPRWVTR